ncbi:MAG: DUF4041 domain-containing protein [Oligoflexia bacterium]|nr:DUF4041 domain-containing protein [Oligoflexia bacterium]
MTLILILILVIGVFTFFLFREKKITENLKQTIQTSTQAADDESKRLTSIINDIGGGDLIVLKEKTGQYKIALKELEDKCSQLEQINREYEKQIDENRKQLIVTEEELLLESFALYKPKFDFVSSEDYKKRLEEIRDRQKELIKNGKAVSGNQNWTVNNNKSQGKKMAGDMVKLVLRSFNNECESCVDNVKFNNIETHQKRIEKSFETLNKLGQIMQVSISDLYRELKLEELYLAHEYQEKKLEEKENQKKAREELREQQKLEQEIKQARDKIAKERKHFKAALNELEKKLKESENESDKKLINDKMDEMKQQYEALEKEEQVIDYREKNAKAGYVYVISNIGAFGENVYKIGMTRRLDPMERIDELGDASVPFMFDVHVLIFSEDAPSLEAKIHQHFHVSRLNKVNSRKEFYKTDIREIEKVIHENYDKIVDVVRVAPAEQYRQSLLAS